VQIGEALIAVGFLLLVPYRRHPKPNEIENTPG
jgi:hypothetical protein